MAERKICSVNFRCFHFKRNLSATFIKSQYEITTTFKPEICRNLNKKVRLRQILIINFRIKDLKTNIRDKTQEELTSTKKNRLPYTTYYGIMASAVKHNTGIATKKTY